jgi:uncharacterized protein YecE (DUF72 family)
VTPRLWIGTSGWNYKHWRKRFYPEDLPPSQWFDFYCEHFDTVEINNSFYREPAAKTYDHWREQAGDNFCYAVKAHRYLTHLKRLLDFEKPLDRVIKGARRLEDHLGPILYQLPPNFKRNETNVERLDEFCEALPRDLMHAIEFRDKSWYDDDSVEQLRRHGVAYVGHDMLGAEVPLVATASFAYVRFHGASQKYHGNYQEETLKEYACRLRALDCEEVFCYFNNDGFAHAVRNAKTLGRMVNSEE